MVKIHGGVYVVLGILMSLYAKFVEAKVHKPGMVLFFWIGLGFIGFGVFRLIINYVFKSKSSTKKDTVSELEKMKLEREKIMQQDNSNNANQQFSFNKEIISCSRCGTKHYNSSNFCHMCGTQLK